MNKTIIENYKKMRIGIDEPFKFHCTQCGECCMHREDILLNPRDLFRIAKKLNLSPNEIVSKYCEAYIGNDSKFPIVRLHPQGSQQRCPLLSGCKCSVHDVKPSICAMFPIGRMMEQSANDATSSMTKVEYVFVNPECGDDAEVHTVREWFRQFDIPLEDSYYIEWTNVLMEMSTVFRDIEQYLDEDNMSLIWRSTFVGLYLKYDTNQPFYEQFHSNASDLLCLLRKFPYDTVKAS